MDCRGKEGKQGMEEPKKDWKKGGFIQFIEADPSKIKSWENLRNPEYWAEESRRKAAAKISEVASGQNGDPKTCDEALGNGNENRDHQLDSTIPGNDGLGEARVSNLIIGDGREEKVGLMEVSESGKGVIDADPSPPVILPVEDNVGVICAKPQCATLDSLASNNNGLQETVNSLAAEVGSLKAEVRELKEKLAKSSTLEIPPQPSASAGPSTLNGALQGGSDDVMEVDTDLSSGLDHCLICNGKVPSSTHGGSDDLPLIDKQVDRIFILRKVLCIPSTSLEKYLTMFPERNPDSWITLCGECQKMVEEARAAWRRFQVIQEQVVRKMKISCEKSVGESRSGTQDIRQVVTEESRKFVAEYNLGDFHDPIPQGDMQAYRLLISTRRNETGRPAAERETGFEYAKEESDKDDNKLEENSKDSFGQPSSSSQAERESSSESKHDSEEFVSPKKPQREQLSRKRTSRKRLKDREGAFLLEDGKLVFRCQFSACSMVFTTKKGYKTHKLSHSGETPKFSCDQCEKVYKTAYGLYLHKKIIHEKVTQCKCSQCGKTISTKNHLDRHMKRVHRKEYDFHCDLCGKGEGCLSDLRYHQAGVHGICSAEGCKMAIPGGRKGLRDHQIEVHGNEIDVLACPDCDKLFVGLGHLSQHRRQIHEFNGK